MLVSRLRAFLKVLPGTLRVAIHQPFHSHEESGQCHLAARFRALAARDPVEELDLADPVAQEFEHLLIGIGGPVGRPLC